MGFRFFVIFMICVCSLLADTFHNQNALKEFLNMQSKIKFGVQQRACGTCDWSVSYPLESNFTTQSIDSINLDSIKSPQNSQNLAPLNTQNVKNMEQVLQYSAMQDLFDASVESEDSTNYEFLGQRGGGSYLDNLDANNSLFKNPLNTQNPQLQQNLANQNTQNIKLTKATFMKRNIAYAYEQILKHKGVITCMYCGELDKIAPSLPADSKVAKFHNVTYTFTPQMQGVPPNTSQSLKPNTPSQNSSPSQSLKPNPTPSQGFSQNTSPSQSVSPNTQGFSQNTSPSQSVSPNTQGFSQNTSPNTPSGLYRIDIADSVCGVVDSLIFVTDKVSTQLFVYSRLNCKG